MLLSSWIYNNYKKKRKLNLQSNKEDRSLKGSIKKWLNFIILEKKIKEKKYAVNIQFTYTNKLQKQF